MLFFPNSEHHYAWSLPSHLFRLPLGFNYIGFQLARVTVNIVSKNFSSADENGKQWKTDVTNRDSEKYDPFNYDYYNEHTNAGVEEASGG